MPVSRKRPPWDDRARRGAPVPRDAASGDPIASAYAAAIARTILAAAESLASQGGGVGRRRLINHLRGNQLPRGDRPRPGPGFGVLESHRAGWVEEAVDRLAEEGLLGLEVLPAGGALVSASRSGQKALGGGPIPPGVLPGRPRLGTHPRLEERLRGLRRRLAVDEGRPAFSIFPNAVLAALAERRPRTLAELADVPGLGAPRIAKYGRRILDALGKG
jgi:superfamily II DNA helicase RecQ